VDTVNRLKELREDAMMTVRELSERSGVSEDTITKIENGHRKGRGVTLRKLAKALKVEPQLLSPEYFAGGTVERENSADSSPGGFDISGDKSQQAYEIVKAVEEQSGLGESDLRTAQSRFERLSEQQREVLLAAVHSGDLESSTIAEQLGCSVDFVEHALAILGEYGLVQWTESGERQATQLARVLARGGLYYNEALEHVASLTKAYEALLQGVPHRVIFEPQNLDDKFEARRFYWMQETIVELIRRIIDAAEPPPLAQKLRKDHSGDSGAIEAPEGIRVRDTAEFVWRALNKCNANPPSRRVIRAAIEGVPTDAVIEAVNGVVAGQRAGGEDDNDDAYKNFLWLLKKPRSRRDRTQREEETEGSRQTPFPWSG
jgi:transcriptional regulator with XRE-family HTH domain